MLTVCEDSKDGCEAETLYMKEMNIIITLIQGSQALLYNLAALNPWGRAIASSMYTYTALPVDLTRGSSILDTL
jgi:hypothetical protein